MNYELIKAAVAAVIKENGNEEITGNLLQQVLHSIINILGVGYQYMGMATPYTVPGTPDARQFYFAAEEGAYSNFSTSPITELDGRELAIFYYDTAWHVVMTGVATRDAMVGYAFYGESLASGSVITGIDENTFFLVGPGTYTINGYSTTISTPGISALMYDASIDELTEYTLLPYDTTPTEDSKNAITSGAVKTALDSKIDKVLDALTGEIPVFDGDGGLDGSTKFLSDYATQDDLDEVNARIDIVAGEAGLAEAVIDTDNAGTEQEFTFRKSGGDGGAYYRKIKGKTLAWNQLCNAKSGTLYDITATAGTDGIITISGTASGTGTFAISDGFNVTPSHKYLILGGTPQIPIFIGGYSSSRDSGNGVIVQVNPGDSASRALSFFVTSGGSYSGTVRPICIDLTQMFGAGNEPSSVAEFEALYPDAYYPYNPGTLISNDADAVETTGANQWDEEWENGTIDENGNKVANPNSIRSKNYIPVFQLMQYYIRVPSDYTSWIGVTYYDAGKNFISGGAISNNTFTPPANARYILVNLSSAYGATYNHDICINLSNAAINGQYFPYWKRTLQLGLTTKEDTDGNVPFADGMKGVGTAADWCDKIGGEKVMYKVDLGTITNWVKGTFTIYSDNNNVPLGGALICDKYAVLNSAITGDSPDKVIGISNAAGRITLRDSSITATTAEGIAEALSGTHIVVQRTAPIPFTWKEPLNLGVKVDENGTERAVAPEGATAPSAPFVADTTYTMSIARMVAKLNTI